ncbi:MAG: hypothetical protein US54_C0021G0007 [Candidatus Roizmanbacteria bacterium GW2011_GWA2_37_7]|uniref:Uncharacterized protein n=1 Tax=Candidatus Roizmanbacteria bacterium GW2011_GWA2_37_7 TaxID=1618481 RepID=A0A0G0HHF1_9BACT|nr:MAG: hypothetical protein US54_C0021G0007 [Candidatus Roizmanbacteria bacterium GW2011_GWA2_37_7]
MDTDYTSIDVDAFKKRFVNQSKSNILFIVIAILTIIVLGLLVVILMQRPGV